MSGHTPALEIVPPSATEVLESIADGFAALDSQWRHTYVNPAALRMLGKSKSQMLGYRPWEIFPSLDHERLKSNLEAAVAEKRIITFENESPLNGRVYECRIYPSTTGASLFFADITEQKETLRRLNESEERFRATFEQAAVGIAHVSPEGRWLGVNSGLCQIVGYSKEELLSLTFQDITHPDDLSTDMSHVNELLAGTRDQFTMEKRYIRKNGSIVWASLHVALARKADGSPDYFISVIQNISEQKLHERVGQEASQRLVSTLENIKDGFVSLDRDWKYGYVNEAGLQILQKSREQVMGKTPWEVFPDIDKNVLIGQFEQAIRTNTMIAYDNFYPAFGRWYENRIYPSFDGVSLFFSDTTARKLAEQEAKAAREAAEAANRAKDRFLATLSHELRTPLNPVLMTVSALASDNSLPADVQYELGMIRRNLELEARLIDDLLDLSRVISGKMKLDIRATNVHTLVRNAVDIFAGTMVERKLKCSINLNAADDKVSADPARLQQVFWNLLSNAIKFTPEGGEISVESSNPAPGTLSMRITDSGDGIRADDLQRIFDAFDQGESNASRKHGGLGLGLAISKAILDLHDGSISADSTGKGGGACFTVQLPTTALAQNVEPALPISQKPDRTLNILLVDDHHDTLRSLQRLMQRKGFNVVTASSIAIATHMLAQHPIDVLVSDIGLPDGSGHDLMRQVKEKWPIPGIAVSGFGMDADLKESAESGFVEHITKPIDLDYLIKTIHRIAMKV